MFFRLVRLFVAACVAVLTIPAHASGDTLLEAAVLAAVPVDPLDGALLVLGAWSVLDLLLD